MKNATTLRLIATLLFFGQMLNAQSKIDIKCEPKSSGVCECRVVGYKDIKGALTTKEPKADFKVFWDFGDGTFTPSRPGQEIVSHRYKSAKNYTVTAYSIVEYANQKFAPSTTNVNISKVSNGASEVVSSFSIKSSLDNVRRIRPEDYFVLVVSMPDKGSLSLDFDPSVFAIDGEPRGTAGVSRSGNTLQSNGKQNIFIPMRSLRFGVNSAKPEQTTLKARWNNQNSNTLILTKHAAYDPNDLKVETRKLKWSEFNGKTEFPLKYTLRFENLGSNEANNVQIKVKIPEGMTYKQKGKDGSFGLLAYGFGNTNIKGPNIITNFDCPVCKDSSREVRCFRVTEPEKDGSPLLFEFQNIPLAPKTSGKENKGYVQYNLFVNKKVEKKTLRSYADIVFDNNGKAITTNPANVRFKPQPRLSLRVGRSVELPLKNEDKANYEVGLSVSRLRPYGFYFPTEIGVSVLSEELKDVNTIIKGIPVRLSQQIRHNFLGGFLGLGAGLSANISINKKSENQNTNDPVSFTKLLAFVDLNINALKQKPNIGVRLGYPLTQKFQPVNGTSGQFQVYVAYQF